jgi:hypothetical protein
MDQEGLLGETGWVSEIETPTNDEYNTETYKHSPWKRDALILMQNYGETQHVTDW